jgi:hypothetical protein
LLQSQLSKANLQNEEYGSDKPRACGFVLGGSYTLVFGKSRLKDVTLEFCSPLCVWNLSSFLYLSFIFRKKLKFSFLGLNPKP